jgi:hypothetical protein
LCVCVRVCMHVCECTYIYIWKERVGICVYMYVCIYVCICFIYMDYWDNIGVESTLIRKEWNITDSSKQLIFKMLHFKEIILDDDALISQGLEKHNLCHQWLLIGSPMHRKLRILLEEYTLGFWLGSSTVS